MISVSASGRWSGRVTSRPLPDARDELDSIDPARASQATMKGAAPGAGTPMNATNEGECYSFHPGGMAVVFGDGSTRLLTEAIDLRTFCALVTRAGGETAEVQ